MKPVQIELINFGPYRHAVINFETLDSHPLFLIGGNTGAGKSTLFDAMTLALFDKTSGTRKSDEMRSNFATVNDSVTEVIFHFRKQNRLFRVSRTIRQIRSAARGNKTTEHKPTASLTIVPTIDAEPIEVLATKPVDVGLKIYELLGLNAEQFKQIILLPQNEFRKFLHSESNEKLITLKNIFGVNIYERFSKELQEKYNTTKKDFEQKTLLIKAIFENNIWNDEEKKLLETHDFQTKLESANMILQNHEIELDKVLKLLKDDEKKFNEFSEELEHAFRIVEKFDGLEKYKNQYKLEIELENIKYNFAVNQNTQLSFAQKLANSVNQLDIAKNNLKKARCQLESNQSSIFETENAARNLNNQLNEIKAKSPIIYELRENIISWNVLLEKSRRKTNLETELKKYELEIDKYTSMLDIKNSEIKKLVEDLEIKQKQIIEKDVLNSMKFEYQVVMAIFQGELLNLKKDRMKLENEIEKSNQTIARLDKELQSNITEHDLIKKQLSQSLSKRRELMVAQLRSELQLDAPCDVCGAVEHPYRIHSLAADATKLRITMDEIELLQTQIGKLDSMRTAYLERQEEVKKDLSGLSKTLFETDIAIENSYQKMMNSCDCLEGLSAFDEFKVKSCLEQRGVEIENLFILSQKQADEVKKISSEMEKMREDLVVTEIKLSRSDSFFAATRTQLDGLAFDILLESEEVYFNKIDEAVLVVNSFEEDLAAVEVKCSEINKKLGTFLGNRDQLLLQISDLIAEVQNYELMVENELASSAAVTSDESVLRAWILECYKLPEIQSFISSYVTKKEMLEKNIFKLKQELDGVSLPNLNELSAIKNDLQSKMRESASVYTQQKMRFDQVGQLVNQLEVMISDQQKQLTIYQELSEMHYVMNVDKGSKINLETYVIRVYLEKVLNHANQFYLYELTGGRYQLSLTDNVRDGRKQSGLNIDVLDLTSGSYRSSKTLSGGETFVCALAIALSLSEVVQNETLATSIEALFIDEGFGSLDPEMLELAIEALEKIGENRMVGVISHVSEMKERIAQQLIINKSGDGSSTIVLKTV